MFRARTPGPLPATGTGSIARLSLELDLVSMLGQFLGSESQVQMHRSAHIGEKLPEHPLGMLTFCEVTRLPHRLEEKSWFGLLTDKLLRGSDLQNQSHLRHKSDGIH
jgi:hypothetical protein